MTIDPEIMKKIYDPDTIMDDGELTPEQEERLTFCNRCSVIIQNGVFCETCTEVLNKGQ